MKIRKYFGSKTKQLKHASWFLAGLAFGSGLFWVCIIALLMAVLLDFLCYLVSPSSPSQKEKGGGA